MGLTLSDRGLELLCDGDHDRRSIEEIVRSARQPEPAPRGVIRSISAGGAYFRAKVSIAAVNALSLARAVGWKETYTPQGEKKWLGPCCSRKKPKTYGPPRLPAAIATDDRRTP